jgi:hypothetical protein
LHHAGRSDFGDVVFEVDLTEGSENRRTNFENGGWNGVTEDKMALVVEGLWEGLIIDEGVPGFTTCWSRRDN